MEEIPAGIPLPQIAEAVAQEIAEAVPEEIAEAAPEEIAEAIPEEIAEAIPEEIVEATPEEIVEATPEEIAEAAPEDAAKKPPIVLSPLSSPAGDAPRLAPRSSKADSFEQNPLTALPVEIPAALPFSEVIPSAIIPKAKRASMDDRSRVREAVRSVVEHGDSIKTAGREWKVAPSSIAQWRARYRELLEQTPKPLIDLDSQTRGPGQVYIPEIAQELFTENWDRLVTQTAAHAGAFKQRRRKVFVQTSPLTSWLFSDGELDRGILAGVACALIGVAIVTSFLTADRNVIAPPPPPEPVLRDDLVIDRAEVAARAFLTAANWEERLKLVRQPDVVRGMMEEYYKDNPDGPINDAILSMAMPSRHVVSFSFDIPSQGRSHFLCVVTSGTRYLVDWESSSLYQETWLSKLRRTRPTGPTRIAVTVTKNENAGYFNYAFKDAGRWECYKLGYPGLAINLFGYALKDSKNAIELDAILAIVDQQAVVMEVRFPEVDAKDNQVEIIHILRTEWVPES